MDWATTVLQTADLQGLLMRASRRGGELVAHRGLRLNLNTMTQSLIRAQHAEIKQEEEMGWRMEGRERNREL